MEVVECLRSEKNFSRREILFVLFFFFVGKDWETVMTGFSEDYWGGYVKISKRQDFASKSRFLCATINS